MITREKKVSEAQGLPYGMSKSTKPAMSPAAKAVRHWSFPGDSGFQTRIGSNPLIIYWEPNVQKGLHKWRLTPLPTAPFMPVFIVMSKKMHFPACKKNAYVA
jgi:hypothetical protein